MASSDDASTSGEAAAGNIASTAAMLSFRGVPRRVVQVFANEIGAGGELGERELTPHSEITRTVSSIAVILDYHHGRGSSQVSGRMARRSRSPAQDPRRPESWMWHRRRRHR